MCALCACGLALALGVRGIGGRVEAARRDAVHETIDRTVAARVCTLGRGPEWIAVELCELAAVPFGSRGPIGPTPSRLRLVERASSAEGELLARLVSGDRIRLRLRITPSRGLRNPGGRDRTVERRRRGIGARARLLDARLAVRMQRERSLSRDWDMLRVRLAKRLQAPGAGGRLLAALALGDRTHLEAQDRDAFRRLGIAHLLAVSGLHLALVAALAYALVRVLAVRLPWLAARFDVRVPALAGAALVGLAYGLLTGWGVPVRRAWVFLLASLLVLALGRRRAPFHVLSAAAFGVAVFDPAAVFDLGARLSFSAAAALLAAGPDRATPKRGLVGRAQRACAASLRVSATAIAVTAPVLAWHGVSSSAFGLLANGIGVPATGLLLLPASLVSLVIAGLADGPVADTLLALLERPARVALEVARTAAGWLPAEAVVARPAPAAVALAAVLAIAAARASRTLTRVGLALLVCGWLQVAPRAVVAPEPPRIVVFDVGLGDAILVQGRDAAVLIDAGWALPGGADLGRTVLVPGLSALGIERLDVVVVSHADIDHRGGISAVLAAVRVDELWIPRGASDELLDLTGQAEALGVRVRERGVGDAPEVRGDLSLHPLWPPTISPPGTSRNDRSLVVRVDLAGSRVLLTGDIGAVAEAGLLASGVDLRAHLLKLPHHGSRGSSTAAFLAAVDAEIGLVSAPCSSRGRLPTREALERARAHGMTVWWTGRDGAIVTLLRGDLPTRTSWGWSFEPTCRRTGEALSR